MVKNFISLDNKKKKVDGENRGKIQSKCQCCT